MSTTVLDIIQLQNPATVGNASTPSAEEPELLFEQDLRL